VAKVGVAMATITIAVTRELVVALKSLWRDSAAAGKVVGCTAVRVKALLREIEKALDAAEIEGRDEARLPRAGATRFNRAACYGQPSSPQNRNRMDEAI
jgi:hypothetical protein